MAKKVDTGLNKWDWFELAMSLIGAGATIGGVIFGYQGAKARNKKLSAPHKPQTPLSE